MNVYPIITVLLVGVVCICGCTGTTNPPAQDQAALTTPTPEAAQTETVSNTSLSFEEQIAVLQNETNAEPVPQLKIGENTTVSLPENPTTGYSWNVSVTDGLAIVRDQFIGPEDTQRVGAGGTHEWILEAIAEGNQTFTGVYRRPWEPPSETDVTYSKGYMVIR